MLTCQHCGFSGRQGQTITTEYTYLGGRGHVEVIVCKNRVECWRRWDCQHGLQTATPPERSAAPHNRSIEPPAL